MDKKTLKEIKRFAREKIILGSGPNQVDNSAPLNDLGVKVKNIRIRALKLTQSEFGNLMGVNSSTIARWETQVLKIEKRYEEKLLMVEEIGDLIINDLINGELLKRLAADGHYGVEVIYQKLLFERIIKKSPKQIDPESFLGPHGLCMKLSLAQLIKDLDNDDENRIKNHILREPIDLKTRCLGVTPLMIAAQKGFVKIFKLLVENGEDIRTRDDDGFTMLHHTLQITEKEKNNIHEKVEIASFLLDQGVDPNIPNYISLPAMVYAVTNGFPVALLKKLLDNGASLGLVGQKSSACTPLIISIMTENHEQAKFLIDAGSDINIQDFRGMTALHYAVITKNKELIEYLLSKGADTTIKSDSGETVIELAESLKSPYAEYIKTKGRR